MKKKKIIKGIIFIVLIVILVIAIHTVRNFVIVKNMQNKISNYNKSTNFSEKISQNESDEIKIDINYYKKDNKQAVILERTDANNEKIIMKEYDNGETTNIYWDTKDEKKAQLNKNALISVEIYNELETDNDWQTFLACIFARIKSTNYNGKDCYVVTNYMSPLFVYENEDHVAYIEKATGISVKNIIGEMTTEKEYDFNNVDDSVFNEPDINEYVVENNN